MLILLLTTHILPCSYLAVSRPLNVFVRTEDNDNWRRVLIYVSPVLAFALLFNVPTFLEFYSTYDLAEANEPGSEENFLLLVFLVS